jgi:hypothetical protein
VIVDLKTATFTALCQAHPEFSGAQTAELTDELIADGLVELDNTGAVRVRSGVEPASVGAIAPKLAGYLKSAKVQPVQPPHSPVLGPSAAQLADAQSQLAALGEPREHATDAERCQRAAEREKILRACGLFGSVEAEQASTLGW